PVPPSAAPPAPAVCPPLPPRAASPPLPAGPPLPPALCEHATSSTDTPRTPRPRMKLVPNLTSEPAPISCFSENSGAAIAASCRRGDPGRVRALLLTAVALAAACARVESMAPGDGAADRLVLPPLDLRPSSALDLAGRASLPAEVYAHGERTLYRFNPVTN